jgi:hypothetical protein
MEEKDIIRHGEVSQEVIDRWKKINRRVIEIPVRDGNDEYIGYFKSPDVKTMSAINKINKTDEFEGLRVLFNNCWLDGAEEIRQDGILFIKVGEQLNAMFGNATARLKNL